MQRRVYGSTPLAEATADLDLPVLDRHQLEKLEKIFPPRCIGAQEDPIAAHRYAAVVELVVRLRNAFEAHEPVSQSEQGGDHFNPLDGERART